MVESQQTTGTSDQVCVATDKQRAYGLLSGSTLDGDLKLCDSDYFDCNYSPTLLMQDGVYGEM